MTNPWQMHQDDSGGVPTVPQPSLATAPRDLKPGFDGHVLPRTLSEEEDLKQGASGSVVTKRFIDFEDANYIIVWEDDYGDPGGYAEHVTLEEALEDLNERVEEDEANDTNREYRLFRSVELPLKKQGFIVDEDAL